MIGADHEPGASSVPVPERTGHQLPPPPPPTAGRVPVPEAPDPTTAASRSDAAVCVHDTDLVLIVLQRGPPVQPVGDGGHQSPIVGGRGRLVEIGGLLGGELRRPSCRAGLRCAPAPPIRRSRSVPRPSRSAPHRWATRRRPPRRAVRSVRTGSVWPGRPGSDSIPSGRRPGSPCRTGRRRRSRPVPGKTTLGVGDQPAVVTEFDAGRSNRCAVPRAPR